MGGVSRSQPGESAMKTITLLLGACALAALSTGTAGAGPCTTEIDSLTKLLASKDAGAGPTAGAGATTGQHPPSATMGAADPSTSASSAAADSGRPQHPPTAAMNQATQGGGASSQAGATSPQDVQSQNRGGLTAAQQAEGGRRPASDNLASVQAALSEARGFDQAGREADCMDAIQRAKRLAG